MGTVFGELPTAVQFFIAFLIVLALIVLTFWAIRRFGGKRRSSSSKRLVG